MTVGAGGSLNIIFKAILDPGDEVVVPRPYFVEYGPYIDNHGGVLKLVASTPDFLLDIDAIDAGIGSKTRAVLINSPNNPTGRIYPADSLQALSELLERKSRENGRVIYLVSDEPYRRIVYDGAHVPPAMAAYANTIIASSYSKELSVAGERIGYVAANPAIPRVGELMGGLILANRILGFVNAPALMQRAVARLQGVSVDVTPYQRNRDVLYEALTEAGFELVKPEGAFYLFPRSPIEDDVAFCQEMLKHLVLIVPGRGFGLAGSLPPSLLRGSRGGRWGVAGLPRSGGQVLRERPLGPDGQGDLRYDLRPFASLRSRRRFVSLAAPRAGAQNFAPIPLTIRPDRRFQRLSDLSGGDWPSCIASGRIASLAASSCFASGRIASLATSSCFASGRIASLAALSCFASGRIASLAALSCFARHSDLPCPLRCESARALLIPRMPGPSRADAPCR